MNESLGIDIGGTKIQFCTVDEGMAATPLGRTPTALMRRGTRLFAHDLAELIKTMRPPGCERVGVSLNGVLDHGIVVYSSLMGGRIDLPLETFLRERLGCPVHVDDDIHAMTIAEASIGSGRELPAFAMLNIGTGIGVGCFDGMVLRGRYAAGLISEQPIYVEELQEFRSLDRTVCGRGIREIYRQLSGEDADAVTVFARQGEGDAAAGKTVAIFTRYLAVVLQMISRFYHPERIVVGARSGSRPAVISNRPSVSTTRASMPLLKRRLSSRDLNMRPNWGRCLPTMGEARGCMSMAEATRPARARKRDADRPASAGFFAPIKAHRTFETVIERIVDAIDAQGLGDGARLPTESELARMMEVSRPTLRQALRILENSGVLRIKAGQAGGVFVASEMIPLDVLGKNIAHAIDHAAELLATRRLLEPIVYHLAAENATEGELDRIADTISLMERHIADPRMVQRADGMFHRRIAHAAGNQILLRTMSGIYRQLDPLRGALDNDESHGWHMIEVHTKQLDAIRARDHDRLELVLQETFVDLEVEFHADTRYRIRWLQTSDAIGSNHVGNPLSKRSDANT